MCANLGICAGLLKIPSFIITCNEMLTTLAVHLPSMNDGSVQSIKEDKIGDYFSGSNSYVILR